MFSRYHVAYAVNPTTRRMEFHHQGYKSYPQTEVVLICWFEMAIYTQLNWLSGQRVAQFEGVQDIHNVRDRLLKVA